MMGFWLAFLVAVTPTPRDPKNVARFRRQMSCPEHVRDAKGRWVSCALYKEVEVDGVKKMEMYWPCGGCDVDHLCPLKCGGSDTFRNMHWMDSKANRSKGADCSACPSR